MKIKKPIIKEGYNPLPKGAIQPKPTPAPPNSSKNKHKGE